MHSVRLAWPSRSSAITALLILLVMVIGAILLITEASREPYHIDELRQVGYYSQSIPDVIEDSFGMEQPPLDMVTNAIAQRVLGTGDVRQRIMSIVFGVGSLALIAGLSLLAGMGRWAAVAAATALALNPTTIAVTAYARPYALPTFLTLAFLFFSIKWLKSGGIVWAVGLGTVAVALLLSRPTEPYLFIAISAGTLLLWQVITTAFDWSRVVYILTVSAGSLALVGRPILARICGEVDQCGGFSTSVLTQVTRLWTDAPAAFVDVLWRPLIVLVAVITFLAVPTARATLARAWWFWALTLTAFAAVAAFFVLSDPTLGFASKYTYLLHVILALVIGALVHAATNVGPGTGLAIAGRVASGTVAAIAILLLGSSAVATVTTETRVDYAALAAMALNEGEGRAIITDSPRSLGRWRPWMYGRDRYYDADAPFVRVTDLLYDPRILDTTSPPAMLLIGMPEFDIADPFVAIETRNGTLILDPRATSGADAAANLLIAVGTALGNDLGTTPLLTGAFLHIESGDLQKGCVVVADVASIESVSTSVFDSILTVGWFAEEPLRCETAVQARE